MREVAGNKSGAHELAVGGDGDEVLKAVSEAREDLADVRDQNLTTNRRGSIALEGLPEAIACQVTEGKFGIVLIIVFADEQEARSEAVTECLAPRDALWGGKALVNEIECGEEQQWLVRSLMRATLLHRRGADI